MFRYIRDQIKRDEDLPARAFTMDVLGRLVEGTFYDHLPHGFHTEEAENGEYVKVRDRRPCTRYALCRLVVDDSVSLLFSEGHFPHVEAGDDEALVDAIGKLITATTLNETMIEAATIGSVGSSAIFMQALKQEADGKPAGGEQYALFFSAHCTTYLTPAYDKQNPKKLVKMSEQYKITGQQVRDLGYGVDVVSDDELRVIYWWRVEWDAEEERHFVPWKVKDPTRAANFVPVRDDTRSVPHSLGFVPWVWIKNLPGKVPGGSDFDGACTFWDAIETNIEIDYQLSQAGRGLKYSSDPTLLIKEPLQSEDGEIVKGGNNAIQVGKDGDAKMLEIDGTASAAVVEYVRALREWALESIHGNRANADKISAAQSGRAMELMNQALIWLADKLRISYGQGALLSLIRMALAANKKYPLYCDGEKFGDFDPKSKVSLRWPRYYAPTATDRQADMMAITGYVGATVMSRETAIKCIMADFDIDDAEAELKLVEAEQLAADAREVDKTTKINASKKPPAGP